MDNIVFQNINRSSLTDNEKNHLTIIASSLIIKGVPVIFDIHQVRLLFGIDGEIGIFVQKNCAKYSILKKNRDERTIYQPSYKLKKIQRWIVSNILSKIKISKSCHAFVPEKSILTNAKAHVHEDPFWIYKTDIINFFGEINFITVKDIFFSVGYSQDVSEILTSLCMYDGVLAQGFPTSPIISNIVLSNFDEELDVISQRYNFVYSRYADDITISGTQLRNKDIEKIKNIITYKLHHLGFEINKNKTKFFGFKADKKVTGVVIKNGQLFCPQKYKKLLNKELYYINKYGVDSHLIHNEKTLISNYIGYLYGYAGYIKMIEPDVGDEYVKKLNSIFWISNSEQAPS
ncbi:MAG: RNA-directed DNA polymerase [Erysipelotrichia bacterium]|nr:RNA-directed DNA polymerase [Erysipelotrichia bacterium]